MMKRIRIWEKICFFALEPASPIPLAVLRIGVAGALLVQALLVSPLLFDVYGLFGIMQGTLNDYFGSGLPSVPILVRKLHQLGVSEKTSLWVLGGSYLVSLIALTAGFHTRVAAVFAWFLHLLFSQGHTTSYGADTFNHIFLFYLIWAPCGAALSVDNWLGRVTNAPSWNARLALRVIQLHLCLMYVSSGIEKSLGLQWWNGEVIWRAHMLPVYKQLDFSWLSGYPWLCKIAGWGTLLVEIGYPLFIWPSLTRRLWVALTMSLHIGIALFLGLHLFGFVMALFTFCAFGLSAEPRKSASFVTLNAPVPNPS